MLNDENTTLNDQNTANLTENDGLNTEKRAEQENSVSQETTPSNGTGETSIPQTDTLSSDEPATKPEVIKPEPKPVVVKEVNSLKDETGQFDYSGCQVHEVQPGETLFDVAQKYVVAVQQLRYFNHIDKQNMTIKPGQKLAIPAEPINVPYGK